MDISVTLSRPGRRVSLRRRKRSRVGRKHRLNPRKRSRVGRKHRLNPEIAKRFLKEKFNVEVVE